MGRIGIYGGAFNPPHIGHIQAAQYGLKALQLDGFFSLCPFKEKRGTDSYKTGQIREDLLSLTFLAFSV